MRSPARYLRTMGLARPADGGSPGAAPPAQTAVRKNTTAVTCQTRPRGDPDGVMLTPPAPQGSREAAQRGTYDPLAHAQACSAPPGSSGASASPTGSPSSRATFASDAM